MNMPNNEIAALLRLIDDPDDEIYSTVASRLIDYGRDIIPRLEQLWEVTLDETVQDRIESLIHRVHFENLQKDFMNWCNADKPDLLTGAILVAQYQYPELNKQNILNQFEQIRRNIWLELNNYLSPVEQVSVFNSIFYKFYKFHGHELTERESKFFYINHVLESKQGNAYSLGVLFLALYEVLDVPIFAVNVPRQFIFAYIDTVHDLLNKNNEGEPQIQFFIDPANGLIYSLKDVDTYLKKINATEKDEYFIPILPKKIIYKMIEELCLCYRYRKEEIKADELQQLMRMIRDSDH